MDEILEFGKLTLVVAAGFSLALMASKVTERFGVPGPFLFLVPAAVASDLAPELHDYLSILTVERLGVIALIVILFDGGMHVGWRRFRESAFPIASLGTVGTFATAAVVAVAGHELFGFSWETSWLLGAALAPTDPAVMFSVLGNREVGGRSGTILEGESGANDPVGIALMIGIIELATSDEASYAAVAGEFSLSMVVGLVVGVLGAIALLPVMREISLPDESLYPLRTLAAAGVIYGVASVAHGSGFLAVFVAGLLIGDAPAPYKREIERFHTSLASLAEIVVFVALGLTVDLSPLADGWLWLDALLIAVIVTFVARPLVVAALLLPVRLRWGERLFVMWGGFKGAVPILLAALAVLAPVAEADRLYAIVFVVVAFSVLVQGTPIAWVADRLGVPMRIVATEPWDVSIRLRDEPRDLHRFVVGLGARAAEAPIRDLRLGERAWISLILRDGQPVKAHGAALLAAGDEVLVICDERDAELLRRFFEGPAASPST